MSSDPQSHSWCLQMPPVLKDSGTVRLAVLLLFINSTKKYENIFLPTT